MRQQFIMLHVNYYYVVNIIVMLLCPRNHCTHYKAIDSISFMGIATLIIPCPPNSLGAVNCLSCRVHISLQLELKGEILPLLSLGFRGSGIGTAISELPFSITMRGSFRSFSTILLGQVQR